MKTDEILAQLFGGVATIKVMRLFLFNEELAPTLEELTYKAQENAEWVKNAAEYLEKLGFLKKKSAFREEEGKKASKTVWVLNPAFPLNDALRMFFHRATLIAPKEIIRTLDPTSNLKMVAIAGIFLENPESELDLLIVADNIRKGALEKAIAKIEATLGREIRYAAFESGEFLYRYGMYDKLIRDVLDFPHEKIFNKLAILGG